MRTPHKSCTSQASHWLRERSRSRITKLLHSTVREWWLTQARDEHARDRQFSIECSVETGHKIHLRTVRLPRASGTQMLTDMLAGPQNCGYPLRTQSVCLLVTREQKCVGEQETSKPSVTTSPPHNQSGHHVTSPQPIRSPRHLLATNQATPFREGNSVEFKDGESNTPVCLFLPEVRTSDHHEVGPSLCKATTAIVSDSCSVRLCISGGGREVSPHVQPQHDRPRVSPGGEVRYMHALAHHTTQAWGQPRRRGEIHARFSSPQSTGLGSAQAERNRHQLAEGEDNSEHHWEQQLVWESKAVVKCLLIEMAIFTLLIEMAIFTLLIEMAIFTLLIEMAIFTLLIEMAIFTLLIEMAIFTLLIEMAIFTLLIEMAIFKHF
ncbi:hypothetical protein P4O66_014013 [Electrophorus voltai]|uniref:Uncharacterized protein n=1 Tax=Electrophorus voltai TaxID=2609070 RepID=A0AAD8Z0P6_9TELE|nr:hypothetical protein P4O66_014013 [Electrophorus voltai]